MTIAHAHIATLKRSIVQPQGKETSTAIVRYFEILCYYFKAVGTTSSV